MAAVRRAYWKGYLKRSLVTCPIALYPPQKFVPTDEIDRRNFDRPY